jgi:D-tyrosyl-tRNA(Tyr) deacylase
VTSASVRLGDETTGAIERGFLVLLGVAEEDEAADLDYLVKKVAALRVFPDGDGKMNLALGEVGGALLVVSQFTLIADTAKGNRPSFFRAARPAKAEPMYEEFVRRMRALGLPVETGRFGADMAVALVNDGPVTILLDSREAR